jgi:phospholipid/cholesterol/gamma-HCH transport system permease protein
MNRERHNSAGQAVHFELHENGVNRSVLELSGQLDMDSAPRLWRELKQKLAATHVAALEINTGGLTHYDSAGLGLLYFLNQAQMTPEAQVTLREPKPELEKALQIFSMEDYQVFQSQQPNKQSMAEYVGTGVMGLASDLKEMVAFTGQVSSGLVGLFFHPRQIRMGEVLRIFESAGVNALPIVSLISLLVGVIIAFEAAQPLAEFGAQIFVANMIGLVMVRELGPLMTAILLAGRSGSAFAAELGTMKVNEELNALETMGLDPVRFLVVQRLLASLLLTPLLTIYSMFTGVLGGVLVMLALGFTLPTILVQLESSVHIQDIAFGTTKGFVFGVIVAGIACLRGLRTKSGPSAVGQATTRAVVSGILLIVIADAVFAGLLFVFNK